jgi:hypothetical protein
VFWIYVPELVNGELSFCLMGDHNSDCPLGLRIWRTYFPTSGSMALTSVCVVPHSPTLASLTFHVHLVPIATRHPPDNVYFEIADVNEPWRYRNNTFDFVHARSISMAVSLTPPICPQTSARLTL